MARYKHITPEAAEYLKWKEELRADPEYQAVYEEEAPNIDLWLELVEARLAAGLTQKQMAARMGVSQAQVARIEKNGYSSYTLNSLRKYVAALGQGYALEICIRKPTPEVEAEQDDREPVV